MPRFPRVRVVGAASALLLSAVLGCGRGPEPASSGTSASGSSPETSCLDGGPTPELPAGLTFIDPSSPEGSDPATRACTRLIRLETSPLTPEVAARVPKKFLGSFTYIYRGDDGEVVMVDGGYTHWATGGTASEPIIEEQLEAEALLELAVATLAPGKGLGDVAAMYFDHGHLDHIMQAAWLRDARTTPLEIWAGEGDRFLIESADGALDCSGGNVPDDMRPLFTEYRAPDYEVRYVPTAEAARAESDWVDGGHGVTLIAAPSHTPGTLMIYLRDVSAVIASNHLKPGDAGTQGDCPSNENSVCKVDCNLYAETLHAFPKGARVLHIHPD